MDAVAVIESILFVAESPVPTAELSEVLEIPPSEVKQAMTDLGNRLASTGSGLVLREAGGGWRIYTRPDLHPFLERYAASPSATRLSKAALEALAVVAYRQKDGNNRIFKSCDDLTAVKGIGPKTAESICSYLKFE